MTTALNASMLWLLAIVPSAALAGEQPQRPNSHPVIDQSFWSHWGDGLAEVSGYRLETTRYGQLRKGHAVAIVVTETFSKSRRVKAEGIAPPADQMPVLKLNFIKDFQTGIYDYNLMTSAFVALESMDGFPVGAPVKVSFSAQEWCGHVYEQMTFVKNRLRYQLHSYFESEADQDETMSNFRHGVSADTLMLWPRGFCGPQMEAGQSGDVAIIDTLEHHRMNHEPIGWGVATLSRVDKAIQINVPAGQFDVELFTVAYKGGRTVELYVERAHPRRIIKWHDSDGETGELLGSERLKYWTMNDPGFEQALRRIGLPTPSTIRSSDVP